MPDVPQRMNSAGFKDASAAIIDLLGREGLPPGQTYVQGSRVAGTARPDSDLDVMHIVSDEDFGAWVAQRLNATTSERIQNQISKMADSQGRLDGFKVSRTLQADAWQNVVPLLPPEFDGLQISMGRESTSYLGPGPLIPLRGAVVAPGVPASPLPALVVPTNGHRP